jgi:type I restriction enzyme, S subunit
VTWPTVNTAQLISEGILEIGDGYRAKNAEFAESGGLPFVRVKDVSTRINTESLDELPLQFISKYEPKVSRPGDSLITMKGTVGRVAFVTEKTPRFVYSPQISYWRPHDTEVIHARWITYWLQGPEFGYQASATKGSTDMADYINLRDQRRMRVSLPPIEIQRTVAEILGSIDDLIENNRRQIEVLEEMAQAIYREWFVNFRFPGHEDATFVDSPLGPIPEGWNVRSLADCSRSLDDGDWVETKDQGGDAYRLLQVSNIGVKRFRETGNYRYVTQETFERLRCREVRVGDLLVARMPDPIGRAWLVDHLKEPAITAVDVAILTPCDEPMGYLLNQVLNSTAFFSHADAVASGTTRKRITRKVLGQYEIVVPSADLLRQFSDAVEPMSKDGIELRLAGDRLASMRNLLLPKLVTGEIDVSDLDLNLLVGATP